MPSMLYLDAARMGRMAPTAQWALQDFVRIAGEEGCTLYFERFIKDGFSAWPSRLQNRFPGLRSWGGVAELKNAIAGSLGLLPKTPSLLAGRSTNLATLAAKWIFEGGRRILITDLTWPSYRRILQREARKSCGSTEFVRIRSAILHRKIEAQSLIDILADHLNETHCDGLFLPEISHDGIRLPIPGIIQAVRRIRESSRVVVDGSQAFGQMPLRLSEIPCDFYLAGCHKWLGSHLPLGVGTFPNPETNQELCRLAARWFENGKVDDPLATFLNRLEAGRWRRFSETVNLSPLFACRGALEDMDCDAFKQRLANARLVRRIAPMTGWTPLDPCEAFCSAAVLLQGDVATTKESSPIELRDRFHARDVALTSYENGLIRLSMPSNPLSQFEAGRLIQALALVQVRAECVARPEGELAYA